MDFIVAIILVVLAVSFNLSFEVADMNNNFEIIELKDYYLIVAFASLDIEGRRIIKSI